MEQSLWIYLSPHLDDAVLSCGGVIWEQVQAGNRVEIWTICAGDPPPGSLTPFAASMHSRWGTEEDAISVRRAEDIRAARILGADIRHLDLADCIYRRLPGTGEAVIHQEDDLWQPLRTEEQPLVQEVIDQLSSRLPQTANLVSPIGIGGHVDHRLTRSAAEGLPNQRNYYADYPYASGVEIRDYVHPAWQERTYLVAPAALVAWQDAIAAYASQISTFWEDVDDMRKALQAYSQHGGGCSLFQS